MRKALLAVSALLALAAAACSPVAAGTRVFTMECAPRGDVARQLRENYGEVQAAFAVTADGSAAELWMAGGGESWTLLITLPNGDSCVPMAGENWTALPAPPAAAGPKL